MRPVEAQEAINKMVDRVVQHKIKAIQARVPSRDLKLIIYLGSKEHYALSYSCTYSFNTYDDNGLCKQEFMGYPFITVKEDSYFAIHTVL